MPLIATRIPRTRQPQSSVRVSASAAGAVRAFLSPIGGQVRDAAAGIAATLYGAPTFGAYRYGRLTNLVAASSQYFELPSKDALNVTGEGTLLWRGRVDTSTGYHSIASKGIGGGGSCPFDVYFESSGRATIWRNGNAWYTPDSAVTPGVVDVVVAWPDDIAVRPTFIVSGVDFTASLTNAGSGAGPAGANTDPLRIGRRQDGVVQLDGGVEVFALLAGRLPVGVLMRLRRRPYALLAPIERRIWVPSAGGSTVPSITTVYAENILATSADYRVTLDYA